MSLLDTASLIVTPNGYKEGKLYSVIPSDGSGDLSVTRATTATRVNSAGLVELVPYNLVQYSQEFDNAWWLKYQVSVAANQTTAPDGTLTAESITNTLNSNSAVYKTGITNFGTNTISCYFKKGTYDYVFLDLNGNSYNFCSFNIATGTVEVISGFSNVTIEDAGNGWYRCYATASDTASVITIGYGTAGSPTAGDVTYIWGAQLNEGTIKPYQKTETRLNIPRLDYSNGTCPSILVEPQRTNIVQYSSSFNSSPWQSSGSFITPNTTTAPDGTLTADTLAASQSQYNWQTIAASTSTTYTMSLYVKLGTATNICLVVNNTTAWNTIGGQSFDSSDGLNTSTWTRIEFTFTTPSSLPVGAINFHIGGNSETGLTQSTGTVYIWGAQLELGSYATSYIPTTSASVTRNADVISKTGISSLIGQTEGTLFVDAYITGKDSSNGSILLATDKVSSGAIIRILYTQTDALRFDVFNGSSFQCQISAGAFNVGDRLKIAGAYKNNDFAMYVNGTQIGTDTSGSVPATDTANINTSIYGDTNGSFIQAAALWKTRLTNTQLAQLTAL